MSNRALIIVRNNDDRKRAQEWADIAPSGTQIEFRRSKRSIPQNSRFWAMLSDVAEQATHNGRKYLPEQWKYIFMHACGHAIEFVPSLDGSTFLPLGSSSSKLTKSEMGDLMEFISAWGAENGIQFHDQKEEAA